MANRSTEFHFRDPFIPAEAKEGHVSDTKKGAPATPPPPNDALCLCLLEETEAERVISYLFMPHISTALLTSDLIDFTPHIAAIQQFPPLRGQINHGNVPL